MGGPGFVKTPKCVFWPCKQTISANSDKKFPKGVEGGGVTSFGKFPKKNIFLGPFPNAALFALFGDYELNSEDV